MQHSVYLITKVNLQNSSRRQTTNFFLCTSYHGIRKKRRYYNFVVWHFIRLTNVSMSCKTRHLPEELLFKSCCHLENSLFSICKRLFLSSIKTVSFCTIFVWHCFILFQRVIYQCTYRGCGEQHITVRSIEAHVRKEHLLKEDPDKFLEEGEEEFYYTEVSTINFER